MAAESGELHTACPLCGSQALEHRWEVSGYGIARCRDCRLVFVHDMVTAEQLDEYYASAGDPSYSEENRALLDYYYGELRKRIENLVPGPGRILDVGCSGGWFLEAMEGWECHGCEIAKADAEIAQRTFGERVFAGSLEDYPAKKEYFDVITMQDVFDHCREPLPTLAKCHAMLKAGGVLVVKVHNISCMYARLSGSRFYAICPPGHLFYFDKGTLSLAVEKSGFDVAKSEFIGHRLKLSTVFLRLSRGRKESLLYRLYQALDHTPLGSLKIRKNLHDIVTLFAVKR